MADRRSPMPDRGRGTVLAECPVVVFTGMNVSAAKLRGFPCNVCEHDLAEHPVEASKLVPSDKAYAMNKSAMSDVEYRNAY